MNECNGEKGRKQKEAKLRSQPKYLGSELSSQTIANHVFNLLLKDSWDLQTTSKGLQLVAKRVNRAINSCKKIHHATPVLGTHTANGDKTHWLQGIGTTTQLKRSLCSFSSMTKSICFSVKNHTSIKRAWTLQLPSESNWKNKCT